MSSAVSTSWRLTYAPPIRMLLRDRPRRSPSWSTGSAKPGRKRRSSHGPIQGSVETISCAGAKSMTSATSSDWPVIPGSSENSGFHFARPAKASIAPATATGYSANSPPGHARHGRGRGGSSARPSIWRKGPIPGSSSRTFTPKAGPPGNSTRISTALAVTWKTGSRSSSSSSSQTGPRATRSRRISCACGSRPWHTCFSWSSVAPPSWEPNSRRHRYRPSV